MSFASKNFKIFSDYYNDNTKKVNQNHCLKMKFLDEDTDSRAWSCNAYAKHQYLCDLVKDMDNFYKPEHDPKPAKELQEHSSVAEFVKEKEKVKEDTPLRFLRLGRDSHKRQNIAMTPGIVPKFENSDHFTFCYEEIPVKTVSEESCAMGDDHLTSITVSMGQRSTHSLQVHIPPRYCPKCHLKVVSMD